MKRFSIVNVFSKQFLHQNVPTKQSATLKAKIAQSAIFKMEKKFKPDEKKLPFRFLDLPLALQQKIVTNLSLENVWNTAIATATNRGEISGRQRDLLKVFASFTMSSAAQKRHVLDLLKNHLAKTKVRILEFNEVVQKEPSGDIELKDLDLKVKDLLILNILPELEVFQIKVEHVFPEPHQGFFKIPWDAKSGDGIVEESLFKPLPTSLKSFKFEIPESTFHAIFMYAWFRDRSFRYQRLQTVTWASGEPLLGTWVINWTLQVRNLQFLKMNVPWATTPGLVNALAQSCRQLQHVELVERSREEEEVQDRFDTKEVETLFDNCEQLTKLLLQATDGYSNSEHFSRWHFEKFGNKWNFEAQYYGEAVEQLVILNLIKQAHWGTINLTSGTSYDDVLQSLTEQKRIESIETLVLKGYNNDNQDRPIFVYQRATDLLQRFPGLKCLDVRKEDACGKAEAYRLDFLHNTSYADWTIRGQYITADTVDMWRQAGVEFHSIQMSENLAYNTQSLSWQEIMTGLLKEQKLPMSHLELVGNGNDERHVHLEMIQHIANRYGSKLETLKLSQNLGWGWSDGLLENVANRKRFPKLTNLGLKCYPRNWPSDLKNLHLDELKGFTDISIVYKDNRYTRELSPQVMQAICSNNPQLRLLNIQTADQDHGGYKSYISTSEEAFSFKSSSLRILVIETRAGGIALETLIRIQRDCPNLGAFEMIFLTSGNRDWETISAGWRLVHPKLPKGWTCPSIWSREPLQNVDVLLKSNLRLTRAAKTAPRLRNFEEKVETLEKELENFVDAEIEKARKKEFSIILSPSELALAQQIATTLMQPVDQRLLSVPNQFEIVGKWLRVGGSSWRSHT